VCAGAAHTKRIPQNYSTQHNMCEPTPALFTGFLRCDMFNNALAGGRAHHRRKAGPRDDTSQRRPARPALVMIASGECCDVYSFLEYHGAVCELQGVSPRAKLPKQGVGRHCCATVALRFRIPAQNTQSTSCLPQEGDFLQQIKREQGISSIARISLSRREPSTTTPTHTPTEHAL
jgi:hypothetical protein